MSRRKRLHRWLRRIFDNRVLAPRAIIVGGIYYVPQEFIDRIKQEAVTSPDWKLPRLGTRIAPLPPLFDVRSREQQWREGAWDARDKADRLPAV